MTEAKTAAGTVPDALDGLDPAKTRKEWLDQVIHSRIRPRLDVHINPVSLTTQAGLVVYVVSIPQSKTAHQASDLKYYKRHNFESVPMQDHEIRDVMARSRHPILEPRFILREHRDSNPPAVSLRVFLRNIGAMRAKDIKVVVWMPYGVFSGKYSSGAKVQIDDQDYSSYTIQTSELIIFPDDEACLTDNFGPIMSNVPFLDLTTSPRYDLRWKIYADDMPPREGRTFLKDIR